MDGTCLVLVELLLHFNFNTRDILFPPEPAQLRPDQNLWTVAGQICPGLQCSHHTGEPGPASTQQIIIFDHDLLPCHLAAQAKICNLEPQLSLLV